MVYSRSHYAFTQRVVVGTEQSKGVAAGVYLLSLTSYAPVLEGEKYELFQDTLVLVLTIAAIAITAIGYLTYKVISERIEKRIQRSVLNGGRRANIFPWYT